MYVSPASNEEKIRDMYAEVSDAVDNQLLSDATGRNALYKIHVSLGKIVNNLDQGQQDGFGKRSVSRATSVFTEDNGDADDKTIVMEAKIMEEEEEGDGDSREGTVIHRDDGDSLVEDLLTDGET